MIDTDLKNTINDILDLFFIKYIPSSQVADYYNCDIACRDFIDYDLLKYYGELEKMKLANSGITAALLLLPPSQNITPVNPGNTFTDGTYFDSLNDDEFADAGFNQPVQTVEGRYLFYEIKTGDTLRRIAQRFYGDSSYWKFIAQENAIYESDLIDIDLTGKIIKIPILEQSQFEERDKYNLVFERYGGDTVDDFQKYYLGRDLALFGGKILTDGTGDLRIAEPVNGVVQNLEDRVNHVQGSLNPLHPEWGLNRIENYSGLPYVVAVEKMLTDLEAQYKADPRVAGVTLNRDGLRVEGDALWIDVSIKLISGITEIERVKVY